MLFNHQCLTEIYNSKYLGRHEYVQMLTKIELFTKTTMVTSYTSKVKLKGFTSYSTAMVILGEVLSNVTCMSNIPFGWIHEMVSSK